MFKVFFIVVVFFTEKFEQAFNFTRHFWSMIGIVMDSNGTISTTKAPSSGDTISTTTAPSGSEQSGMSDKTTHGVSAGLVGALVFIIVIVVVIIVRRRTRKHRRDSNKSEESDAEMDSLEGVAVYQDSGRTEDDVVVCRDGRKLSRRKLIESLWVEDDNLRTVMKRYLVESKKLELGRMLGKGDYIFHIYTGTSNRDFRKAVFCKWY